MNMESKPELKVYYNSACPVCKAGIEGQMDKESSCQIRWNDVHNDTSLVEETGSELEFVRKRLHVIDENGRTYNGFDAFISIWRHSPKETWKAKLLGAPGIRQLCQVAYNLFAEGLYRWNRSKGHW